MSLVTSAIMFALFLVLGAIMLYRAEIDLNAAQLFGKESTCALRGFWSIIIILVHVPGGFQNQLQDMVGSFAYIGVTFFFMTSAYGLKIIASKQGITAFWRRRLPKLLIPLYLSNAITMLIHKKLTFWGLFSISGWVLWLLYCYFVFWLAHVMKLKHKDFSVCICVVFLSLYWFISKSSGGWPTEIYGFIWGILLANNMEKLQRELSLKHWLLQCIVIVVVSGLLGVSYLKYKPVLFYGSYLLKVCLGCSLLLLILCFTRGVKIGNKVNLFLGKISYETYLLHSAVMVAIATIKPDLESAMFIVVSIASTLILAVVIHRISTVILKRIKL